MKKAGFLGPARAILAVLFAAGLAVVVTGLLVHGEVKDFVGHADEYRSLAAKVFTESKLKRVVIFRAIRVFDNIAFRNGTREIINDYYSNAGFNYETIGPHWYSFEEHGKNSTQTFTN